MTEYHKINSLFKRSEDGRRVLFDEWAQPEFDYLQHNKWHFTEKVDGTNIRVIYAPLQPQPVMFGGRTDAAQIPATLIQVLQRRFLNPIALDTFATKFESGVILYGEGYGAKIQKGGGNYRADQGFVLFDVKVGEWWLRRADVHDVAAAFAIEAVPGIGTGTLADMIERCREGFRSQWGDFEAEGIVARPDVELRTRSGHRIITKLKMKDFR